MLYYVFSLSLFSFYVPFSVLAQVGLFPHNLSPPSVSDSLSFARFLCSRPFFRSSSRTSLHIFLGLSFPIFPRTSIFLQADTQSLSCMPLIVPYICMDHYFEFVGLVEVCNRAHIYARWFCVDRRRGKEEPAPVCHVDCG